MRSNRFVNLVTVLVALLTGVVLFGMIMYYWPRQIVDIQIAWIDGTEVITDDGFTIYQNIIEADQGGTAAVEIISSTYVDAKSTYDNRLQCDNNIYELQRFTANTQDREEINPTKAKFEYIVPGIVDPSPPSCKLVVDGRHEVTILPGFTRTYITEFESSNFVDIIRSEGGHNELRD